jgi:hypothetical protein
MLSSKYLSTNHSRSSIPQSKILINTVTQELEELGKKNEFMQIFLQGLTSTKSTIPCGRRPKLKQVKKLHRLGHHTELG